MLKTTKQMRQVNSTHPAPEKVAVIKKLNVSKKKKKGKNEHTTSDSKLYRFLEMSKITSRDLKKQKTNKNQEGSLSRLIGSKSELVYLLAEAEEISPLSRYTVEIKLIITITWFILLCSMGKYHKMTRSI